MSGTAYTCIREVRWSRGARGKGRRGCPGGLRRRSSPRIRKAVVEQRVELLMERGAESKQGIMNETNTGAQELILLTHDRETKGVVPQRRRFRALHRPTRQIAERGRNIFVLVPASELPAVSEFVSIANRRHQLRALLVRDDVQPSLLRRWRCPFHLSEENPKSPRRNICTSGRHSRG